jgi:hypothetical protein
MKRGGVNECGKNIAEINYFVKRTIHGWHKYSDCYSGWGGFLTYGLLSLIF